VTQPERVLSVIVCGAGPASEVGTLVKLAQQRGWTVQLIATPAALDFLDIPALEARTGSPVRHSYRSPGEPRSRPADAVIVAPSTYDTICKCALGISDTYALGILAEAVSRALRLKRPPGTGAPRCSGWLQIRPAHCNRAGASRAGVFLATDCPARGHRLKGAPCGRIPPLRSGQTLDPATTHQDLAPVRKTGDEQDRARREG
jgi:hypothetical protein